MVKKLIMAGILLILFAGLSFGYTTNRANLGVEYNTTPAVTSEVFITSDAVNVSGMEQYIIISGDSTTAEVYAVYWYGDDGTTQVSTETVTLNTLSTIKARKAKFSVTTIRTTDAINCYIYGR